MLSHQDRAPSTQAIPTICMALCFFLSAPICESAPKDEKKQTTSKKPQQKSMTKPKPVPPKKLAPVPPKKPPLNKQPAGSHITYAKPKPTPPNPLPKVASKSVPTKKPVTPPIAKAMPKPKIQPAKVANQSVPPKKEQKPALAKNKPPQPPAKRIAKPTTPPEKKSGLGLHKLAQKTPTPPKTPEKPATQKLGRGQTVQAINHHDKKSGLTTQILHTTTHARGGAKTETTVATYNKNGQAQSLALVDKSGATTKQWQMHNGKAVGETHFENGVRVGGHGLQSSEYDAKTKQTTQVHLDKDGTDRVQVYDKNGQLLHETKRDVYGVAINKSKFDSKTNKLKVVENYEGDKGKVVQNQPAGKAAIGDARDGETRQVIEYKNGTRAYVRYDKKGIAIQSSLEDMKTGKLIKTQEFHKGEYAREKIYDQDENVKNEKSTFTDKVRDITGDNVKAAQARKNEAVKNIQATTKSRIDEHEKTFAATAAEINNNPKLSSTARKEQLEYARQKRDALVHIEHTEGLRQVDDHNSIVDEAKEKRTTSRTQVGVGVQIAADTTALAGTAAAATGGGAAVAVTAKVVSAGAGIVTAGAEKRQRDRDKTDLDGKSSNYNNALSKTNSLDTSKLAKTAEGKEIQDQLDSSKQELSRLSDKTAENQRINTLQRGYADANMRTESVTAAVTAAALPGTKLVTKAATVIGASSKVTKAAVATTKFASRNTVAINSTAVGGESGARVYQAVQNAKEGDGTVQAALKQEASTIATSALGVAGNRGALRMAAGARSGLSGATKSTSVIDTATTAVAQNSGAINTTISTANIAASVASGNAGTNTALNTGTLALGAALGKKPPLKTQSQQQAPRQPAATPPPNQQQTP